MQYKYLRDTNFLANLVKEHLKTYFIKIIVLNKEELPIEEIQGRVTAGSINVDGNSNIRRTCNITFVADEYDNDLTNIDNLLSINKKIKVMIGLKNPYENDYSDIIWFPQGIFVIVSPSITHNANGVTINLNCKDKMCLLNGECGGGLPTSVTFHEYEQVLADGSIEHVPQLIFDIIQTLVCNFGGEPISKIFIHDIERQIKQIVRYVGSASPLYYKASTNQYTTNQNLVLSDPTGDWKAFGFNEDIGYSYEDFVFPGELISNIGDNVCTILDKIKNVLGNFEYFYDIDGNFVFQEVRNYLNNSYDPMNDYRLDNYTKDKTMPENLLALIDDSNYYLDTKSNTKCVYTFEQGTGLVTSFQNSINYANIKNDYHIWGINKNNSAIHYHLAIKEKPKVMNSYKVTFLKNQYGEYDGRIALTDSVPGGRVEGSTIIVNPDFTNVKDGVINFQAGASIENGVINVEAGGGAGGNYVPEDWRAELYLQGLTKQKLGQRPDVFEQELLDLFDGIYNFKEKKFKVDIANNPNNLTYWFDYLEPVQDLYDFSIDSIGKKTFSKNEDNIAKMYNLDIPNVIIISDAMPLEERVAFENRCKTEGVPFSNVSQELYTKIAVGTVGYTAQEHMRDSLYQYTSYNESINISSVPILHLDVNSRITVNDKESNIYGDYVIKSLMIPLDVNGTMTINATRALERI